MTVLHIFTKIAPITHVSHAMVSARSAQDQLTINAATAAIPTQCSQWLTLPVKLVVQMISGRMLGLCACVSHVMRFETYAMVRVTSNVHNELLITISSLHPMLILVYIIFARMDGGPTQRLGNVSRET